MKRCGDCLWFNVQYCKWEDAAGPMPFWADEIAVGENEGSDCDAFYDGTALAVVKIVPGGEL
jgi:hypothetical protein